MKANIQTITLFTRKGKLAVIILLTTMGLWLADGGMSVEAATVDTRVDEARWVATQTDPTKGWQTEPEISPSIPGAEPGVKLCPKTKTFTSC